MSGEAEIVAGSLWRHHKNGALYRVTALATLESWPESGTPMVVYQSVDHPEMVFVRPRREWLEDVEYRSYARGPRFTKAPQGE